VRDWVWQWSSAGWRRRILGCRGGGVWCCESVVGGGSFRGWESLWLMGNWGPRAVRTIIARAR
jgi:hypothetical protein